MQGFTRMSKCLICFEHWKDCECNFANDNHDLDRVVIIPPVELVLTRSYFHRLAIATANLNLSRRKIPDWMANALYRDDIIFIDHGRRIIIQDEAIETAFNNELGFRWLSDFKAFAISPPLQNPQNRMAERLQLLATSFWVHSPAIARHFAR